MRVTLVYGPSGWSDIGMTECKTPIRDFQLTIAIMVRHSMVVITLPSVY